MRRTRLMLSVLAVVTASCNSATSQPTLTPTVTMTVPVISTTAKPADAVVPTEKPTTRPPVQTILPTDVPVGSGIQLLTGGTQAKLIYQSLLRSPEGITVGTDGALYIADWVGHRVMKWTPAGKLTVVVQLPLAGYTAGPRDIAFDASGTLYIATSDQIYRLGADGKLSLFASRPCCMSKIEFGPDGNLYYANERTNEVLSLRPDRTVSVVLRDLQHPFDVAFNPGGEMFVSELGKDIMRANGDGTASLFAQANFGQGDPLHIAFDAKGNLYAHGNGTLFKFDSAGRDLGFLIDNDDPRYMLGFPKANPGGLAFDPSCSLNVADSPNAKITRISPAGHLEILIRGFNPNGIGLGADGNIDAISSANCPQAPGELWRISPEGGLATVATFRDAPLAMTTDTMGNIYVSLQDRTNGRVVRARPDGTVEDLALPPRYYGSMAVTPDSQLAVSSLDGTIYRVAKDGAWQVYAQGPSKGVGAWSFRLAVSPAGTLHVTDGKTGNVSRFADGGGLTVVANMPALIGQPHVATVSPDGSIFILTHKEQDSLWRLDSAGSFRKVANNIWGDPLGLAFDQSGNLYISRGGSIDRISGLVPPR